MQFFLQIRGAFRTRINIYDRDLGIVTSKMFAEVLATSFEAFAEKTDFLCNTFSLKLWQKIYSLISVLRLRKVSKYKISQSCKKFIMTKFVDAFRYLVSLV